MIPAMSRWERDGCVALRRGVESAQHTEGCYSFLFRHSSSCSRLYEKPIHFLPSSYKSSLGSFALSLMVFFITGWSIQVRLIEHEAGSICEVIYQGEGADLTQADQLSSLSEGAHSRRLAGTWASGGREASLPPGSIGG